MVIHANDFVDEWHGGKRWNISGRDASTGTTLRRIRPPHGGLVGTPGYSVVCHRGDGYWRSPRPAGERGRARTLPVTLLGRCTHPPLVQDLLCHGTTLSTLPSLGACARSKNKKTRDSPKHPPSHLVPTQRGCFGRGGRPPRKEGKYAGFFNHVCPSRIHNPQSSLHPYFRKATILQLCHPIH